MRTQCGDDSKQGDYHATGNEQPLHRNLRLARNAEWLAPPDYNQRLQADVTCITYHGLVFSGVSRFYRVSGPAIYRRSSTSGHQQYQRHAITTATSPIKIRPSKSDFSHIGPSGWFQTASLRLKGDFIDAVMHGVSVEVSET